MRIGELARITGLAASRIRYYESSGLIASVKRSANGYREFAEDTPLLLDIIQRAQYAGFSLAEIRRMLPASAGQQWPREQLLSSLRSKVQDIEKLEQQLRENRLKLLQVIVQVEQQPDDADCAANAARVMAQAGSL